MFARLLKPSPIRLAAALAVASIALPAAAASAATVTRVITAASFDYELADTNQPVSGASFGIVGGSNDRGAARNIILPFLLPQLEAGETISSATLGVHLETRFGSDLTFNTDAYLLTLMPSPTVVAEGYVAGPTSTSGYRIADNFITPQTALGVVSANITSDVKSTYSPGYYLYIRLNPDAVLTANASGFQLGMSEDPSNAPTLTLVTTGAPEPATLAALAIASPLLRRRRRR